ncbi:ankyrin repeat domain-containing protein 26-like [Rousettus aegyptiacus]|nr:ankyrin repeat domain-containing protein 26-like [Rousettus aegyptiacus]
MRSEMERRIKDLESELCKMKTSQEESNKVELEKYKQLYLQELKSRKSLAIKLNKTDERLAEMNTKLLVKKQQNKSLLSSLLMRPVLEPQGVGSLNHGLISHSNLAPRADLVTPVSTPRTSNNSLETYLSKVGYVIFFPLGFRFLR